jgi:hypothetical protein
MITESGRLTPLGLASISLGAAFITGLYFRYRHSYQVDCSSREVECIRSEARRAELRAQELGRLARAWITVIANQSES